MISWRSNSSLGVLLLRLILPVNLIIFMLVLFIQLFYLQFEIKSGDFIAKRIFLETLKEVVSDTENNLKDIPEWAAFIAMEDGTILFPFDSIIDKVLVEKIQKNSVEDGRYQDIFMSRLVQMVPEHTEITSFRYKGQKGVLLYRSNLLPLLFRILEKSEYLIFLFLIVMSLFISGMFRMHSIEKNTASLIDAFKRIRGADLDTPIKKNFLEKSEFSEVISAFEEMRIQLNEQRSQGIRMIMSITHDLKTPLTSIRMYLEALSDGIIATPEEAFNAVDKILQKTGLLEERIDEMLDFTKGVTSGMEVLNETIVVDDWVNKIVKYFEEECHIKNRNFTVEQDIPEHLMMNGNLKMLDRGVMNLFDNAYRYSAENDQIKLSIFLTQDNQSLNLIIEDSGPGVDEKDREVIFDLFFRKDRGRNTRGMGIGLASVKFIVESHGGNILCDKSSLGGALFRIELPLFL